MKKFYKGHHVYSTVNYDASHYQELSADWYEIACAEREENNQEAAGSFRIAAIFAAQARYLMGLQD